MVWKQLAHSNGNLIPVNHFTLLKHILALLQSLWLIFCLPLLSRNRWRCHWRGNRVMAPRFLFRSAILCAEWHGINLLCRPSWKCTSFDLHRDTVIIWNRYKEIISGWDLQLWWQVEVILLLLLLLLVFIRHRKSDARRVCADPSICAHCSFNRTFNIKVFYHRRSSCLWLRLSLHPQPGPLVSKHTGESCDDAAVPSWTYIYIP